MYSHATFYFLRLNVDSFGRDKNEITVGLCWSKSLRHGFIRILSLCLTFFVATGLGDEPNPNIYYRTYVFSIAFPGNMGYTALVTQINSNARDSVFFALAKAHVILCIEEVVSQQSGLCF